MTVTTSRAVVVTLVVLWCATVWFGIVPTGVTATDVDSSPGSAAIQSHLESAAIEFGADVERPVRRNSVAGGDERLAVKVQCSVSPSTATTGETVRINASESTDADLYRYDFDGDGTYDTDYLSKAVQNTTYQNSDSYTPIVQALNTTTDETDTNECGTVQVEPPNDPPDPAFTWRPDPAVAGERTTLDASNSTDPDGTIVEYRWDFDGNGVVDNTTSDPVTAYQFAYDETGEGFAVVRLTVVDDDGASSTIERDLRIVRPPVSVQCTVSPKSASVGERVTVDASGTDNADRYRFDFDGDGNYDTDFVSNSIENTTYDDPASYTPIVQARNRTTDDTDTNECGSVDVSPGNDPPAPSFTWNPDPAVAGESTRLDASGSSDPDGTIVEYRWDFDGDGVVDNVTSDPVTSYQFAYDETGEGFALVRLTAVDDDGATSTYEQDLPIARPEVRARCSVSPTTAAVGEEVTVDASESENADLYRFDFDGDGNYDTDFNSTAVRTTTYDGSDEYVPIVQVANSSTDQLDGEECGVVQVEDQNDPPDPTFTWNPDPAVAGDSTTLDASDSVDPDGGIVEYRWDFDGDGSIDRVTNSSTTTYEFAYDETGEGFALVTLTVVDDGGATRTVERDVPIVRPEVTAQCSVVPDSATTGDEVSIRVDPGSRADAFQYARDTPGEFGPLTDQRVEFVVYDDPGEYTPRVRAVDTSTDQSTVVECGSVTVESSNTPPTAVLEIRQTNPDSGTNVTLDASNSTDPDGRIVEYRWDFDGDGTIDRVTNSSTITHSFEDGDQRSVRVVVVDDDGAAGNAQQPVQIEGGFACDLPFGLPCWTAIPGIVVPSAGGGMLLCRRLKDRRFPVPRLPRGGGDKDSGGISEYALGTFETPRGGGRVVVNGLGFEPDVLLFSATSGDSPHRTDGWNYGRAVRHDDGSLTQNVVSVATDADESTGTGGSVRTGQVLDLLVHDDESVAGLAGSIEATTEDGFEAVFDASSLSTESAVGAYTVAYQAFAIPDDADAAIGHTVTPAEPGVETIQLGIDADYVTLTATDATGSFESATLGEEPVAICHGTAVGDAANQQVQTSSVDPSDAMTGAFGAHTDRVLHLLDVADGVIRGRTSARVTELGETLELTYDETDCVTGSAAGEAAEGHQGALVTFVALDADEQAPEVGAVEFPPAEAGGEQSVALGRQPGLVTFTTVPATERATDRVVPGNGLSFGWSHGTALRTADGGVAQSVLQDTVDPDLVAKYGRLLTDEAAQSSAQGDSQTRDTATPDGGTGGGTSRSGRSGGETASPPSLPPAVATVPALDEFGATTGWDALAVTSFDDRGFTLASTSVSSQSRLQATERPLVCYTAWPLLEGGDSGP